MEDNREPWLQHAITPMGNPRFQNVRFAGSAPGGDEWGGVAGVLKWQATYAAHPTQASALIDWQDRQAELALEFAAVIAQIGNGTTVAQSRGILFRHMVEHLRKVESEVQVDQWADAQHHHRQRGAGVINVHELVELSASVYQH